MGLFSRKSQASFAPSEGLRAPAAPETQDAVKISKGSGLDNIEVAGEAHRREGVAAMFQGWGYTAGGVKMCSVVLHREPTDKYDRSAVKVIVDGNHVGYVPSEISPTCAKALKGLRRGQYAYCDARAGGRNNDGTWRARITLIFDGEAEPECNYANE